MTPTGRFAASLFASLILGWRPLEACLRGQMELEQAVLRWAAGLVVAWIALAVISRLIDAYRPEDEEAVEPDTASHATSDPSSAPARRLEDGPLSAS